MNIFVSFHFDDRVFFEGLAETLKRVGHLAYLIDLKRRLGPEKIFDFSALDEELGNTDTVIVLLSKSYVEDSWLSDEFGALMSLESNERPNFIVPVIIDDVEDEKVSRFVRSRPSVRFAKGPNDEALQRLTQLLSFRQAQSNLLVFISHSSHDKKIATALVQLLLLALEIPPETIRCTAVDGFGLHAGTEIERLKKEIYEAKVFIGLITPASLQSVYVLFELGARWGARRQIMPLLAAGAKPNLLRGPLKNISALDCKHWRQIQQLINDISDALKVSTRAGYDVGIDELVRVSKVCTPKSTKKARAAKKSKRV